MKRQRTKQLCSLGVCLLLCLTLAACGKSKTGPETYTLEEETIPSLAGVLPEKGRLASENGPSEDPLERYTYLYENIEDGGQVISDYVDLLTGSEYGFSLVNAAGQLVVPPDYMEDTGFVVLSRLMIEEEAMFRLVIQWDNEAGQITLKLSQPPLSSGYASGIGTTQEGHTDEVDGAEPSTSTSGSSRIPSPLGAEEAVSYVEGLHPSILGLEGESMEDYNVYYLDAKTYVDGYACLTLRVYAVGEPEGSNVIAGTYLLSADHNKLFRLDVLSEDITELSLR